MKVLNRTAFKFLLLLCLLYANKIAAQHFELNKNLKSYNLPFKLIKNMIVVELNINGKGPYNFTVDSGSPLVLIMDPNLIDTTNLLNKRTLLLSGISEGEIFEALIPGPQNFDFGESLKSVNLTPAILKSDYFGVSNFMGIKIHGLLGYEFFTNLKFKFDFTNSLITVFSENAKVSYRKFQKIPITIENKKPYLISNITFYDNSQCNCKLVLDIGAGHGLSLEHTNLKNWPLINTIKANLGRGLTGLITGEIGRVKQLKIGKLKINNPISAFPLNLHTSTLNNNRDGNLGTELLKRYTIIVDFKNELLFLKPRFVYFPNQEHDMSGIELYATGKDLKDIYISRIEPGSPSDQIGLKENDQIFKVNLIPAEEIGVEGLGELFKSENGKSIFIEILREGKRLNFIITLKRRV